MVFTSCRWLWDQVSVTLHDESSRVQLCQGRGYGKVGEGRGVTQSCWGGGVAELSRTGTGTGTNRKSSVLLPQLVCLAYALLSFILFFPRLPPQHFPSPRLLDQSEPRVRSPSRQGAGGDGGSGGVEIGIYQPAKSAAVTEPERGENSRRRPKNERRRARAGRGIEERGEREGGERERRG